MSTALVFLDEDQNRVELDADEATSLFQLTEDLDAATVSACPTCRSRLLAAVALRQLLDEAPPHPRAAELSVFAEDAPTLHIALIDVASGCDHTSWRDPGADEWFEITDEFFEPS